MPMVHRGVLGCYHPRITARWESVSTYHICTMSVVGTREWSLNEVKWSFASNWPTTWCAAGITVTRLSSGHWRCVCSQRPSATDTDVVSDINNWTYWLTDSSSYGSVWYESFLMSQRPSKQNSYLIIKAFKWQLCASVTMQYNLLPANGVDLGC